jgi:hypothetical protein
MATSLSAEAKVCAFVPCHCTLIDCHFSRSTREKMGMYMSGIATLVHYLRYCLVMVKAV